MKLRYLLSLCLLAFMPMAILAQQHPLMGLWQMQMQDGRHGKMKTIDVPVWKSIEGDGTFFNFMIKDRGHSFISQSGTYAIRSDSTYAEQILEHAFDPSLVGTVTMLTYSFINPNMLIVSFDMKGKTVYEMWRRVAVEKPKKKEEGRAPDFDDFDD
ncbi:MAG: DUF4488 domain-containing protein [Alloprevotella sp.]|nr:DUF4488 domain-containing protein [Alloprevotella sp.]MBR6339212.1 DUF4488 domain-containing protein [Alloprevotella sp.]